MRKFGYQHCKQANLIQTMRTLNLSVLLPTLNCVHMLPAHLESMASWMDLADEIVCVDSDSVDGTPEMIRERLKRPGLRSISLGARGSGG